MEKLILSSYKEILYFIAKCLTISFEDRNKEAIEKQLQSYSIDWDVVVKVSTAHYVLPALYCNFHKSNFLHYLPKKLVAYMEHITNLNRKRNEEIITQARKLNTLLLSNNIEPIFLKGTANLIARIYEDIAERMVGDIDFIISKNDYPKAIKVLRDNGYSAVHNYKYHFPNEKHYRRLQKKNSIAAVEIHYELVDKKKYLSEFNYNLVNKDNQVLNGVTVLSYRNKLNLSIIANQINDNGYHFKTIALKNAYDVFLLSKKTNAKNAVNSLGKLTHPLSFFLAACYEIFGKVNSLKYKNTKTIVVCMSIFNSQFINWERTKRKHKRIKTCLLLKSRLGIIYKSILYKKYRDWLFRRLTDIKWYKEKLIQLGFCK